MSSIVDDDDRVVEAALAVLNGERAQGTEGVRRVVRDDGADFVYRVDPDADPSEVEEVEASGEFPDAEAVLWRADRGFVLDEVERRNLDME